MLMEPEEAVELSLNWALFDTDDDDIDDSELSRLPVEEVDDDGSNGDELETSAAIELIT